MTAFDRWVRKQWELPAMAGVMLLAASLRWERIGTRNLWQDEAFSLDVARRSLPEILTFLRGNDAHPAGYYVMLSAWIRLVGQDLAWMRILSVAFGLGAIVLTWRLGRQWFSPAVGAGAAALLALNPFQIFASNELRMYMPLEFLALFSTWALWRASGSPRSVVRWVIYGASLALMGYVSYYSFLLIPAQVLWIFRSRPARDAVRQSAIATVAALALYAPWIPFLVQPVAVVQGGLLNVRGQGLWATYVPEVIASQTFGGYLFNMLGYHIIRGLSLEYYGLLLFLFLVLIAGGAFWLVRVNRPAASLGGLSWGVPVALVVAASLALHRTVAYTYHLNFLQPFLAQFVAAGVVHFQEVVDAAPRRLVTLTAALGVLLFMAPAVENLQWNPEYQAYRFDSAAHLVRKLYQPGDAVVYVPVGARRAFSFYFTPPRRELSIPVDAGHRTRESLQESIRGVAGALTPADTRVWIVYVLPVPEGTVQDLVAAIEGRGYRWVIVNDFKGVSVGLLVRPVRK